MTDAFRKLIEVKNRENSLWARLMFSLTFQQPEEELKKSVLSMQEAMAESQRAFNTWKLTVQE